MPFQKRRNPLWKLIAVLCLGALLCYIFRGYGLVTAVILFGSYIAAHHIHQTSPEIESLRASLQLSLEEIEQDLAEIDQMPKDPAIAAFFNGDQLLEEGNLSVVNSQLYNLITEYQHAQQFAYKARIRLQASLTIEQLERLLAMTDHRAAQLHHAWRVYATAQRLKDH